MIVINEGYEIQAVFISWLLYGYKNKAPRTPAPIITKVGSIFVKAMTAKLIMAIPKVTGLTREVFPREMATAANSPITAGFIPLKLELTITDSL